MSDFILDAPLLACPDPTALPAEEAQDALESYVLILADLWKLRSKMGSMLFWRDNQLSEVLLALNCYPFRPALARAFQHIDVEPAFQLQDAAILAGALLERSHRFEDHGDLRDVVVSDCRLVGDPSRNRPNEFLNYLCRALSLALPVLGDGVQFGPGTCLASCGRPNGSEEVNADFNVDLIEQTDGLYREVNERKAVRIPVYCGAEKFLREIELYVLWAEGTAESIINACSMSVARQVDDAWAGFSNVYGRLSIGTDFISSAIALGFRHDRQKVDRILRVCADVLLKRNLRDTHTLRTGKGGDNPQCQRDDWYAWRCNIDYEFHLHYWLRGDQVELANIVTHNDFGISR